MTFDDRLVSKEQIVRAKTVLTDMHSLAAFGTALALKDRNLPWQGPREIPLEDSYAVANVIQSIVLYDTVVVDSVLLEGHAPAADLFELFPGILKSIFIDFEDRLQIADLITQVTGGSDSIPEQMTVDEWRLLRNHDCFELYSVPLSADEKIESKTVPTLLTSALSGVGKARRQSATVNVAGVP